jgi:hypothetical protein
MSNRGASFKKMWKNPVENFAGSNDRTPYKFDWKPNRNFCLTAKHSLDFEGPNGDEARENGKFLEFALEKGGPYQEGLIVVGYFKSQDSKTLQEAWEYGSHAYFLFLWDRNGECIDGAY